MQPELMRASLEARADGCAMLWREAPSREGSRHLGSHFGSARDALACRGNLRLGGKDLNQRIRRRALPFAGRAQLCTGLRRMVPPDPIGAHSGTRLGRPRLALAGGAHLSPRVSSVFAATHRRSRIERDVITPRVQGQASEEPRLGGEQCVRRNICDVHELECVASVFRPRPLQKAVRVVAARQGSKVRKASPSDVGGRPNVKPARPPVHDRVNPRSHGLKSTLRAPTCRRFSRSY